MEIIKTIIFIPANGIKALVGRVTVTLPLSFTTQGGGGGDLKSLNLEIIKSVIFIQPVLASYGIKGGIKESVVRVTVHSLLRYVTRCLYSE